MSGDDTAGGSGRKAEQWWQALAPERKPYNDMAINLDEVYHQRVAKARFEWDDAKDRENRQKHGVDSSLAQVAFADPKRVIAEDLAHSGSEDRYFCIGAVAGGVLTVRFTYRSNVIRIIGGGYWRKGKQVYERENKIHR
jgi:uncharacterized DUF497 family protein